MSGPLSFLRARRAELSDWLTREGLAHTFSLATWRLQRATEPVLERHARGRLLDAGCGRAPHLEALRARGVAIVTLDVEDRGGSTDLIADLQDMPEVKSGSVDTVLCTQVLEHVPRPWQALAEIARVLAPGGHLILSVPHLSAIHEAPGDYYRYTRYGLDALLTGAGLEVLDIRASGGLFCLLGHGASLLALGTLGAIPGLRRVAWSLNYALLVRGLDWVDRLLGFERVFPCDYVALARKPERP